MEKIVENPNFKRVLDLVRLGYRVNLYYDFGENTPEIYKIHYADGGTDVHMDVPYKLLFHDMWPWAIDNLNIKNRVHIHEYHSSL